MLISFVNFLLAFFQKIAYWGIFFLMTIESSFIPFPSEVVVPPAAYLAAQGKMQLYLVILAALAGSLFGALINYFLAYYLGRPLIYRLAKTKLAKYLLINKDKIKKAEDYFVKYENSSTFFARLIPVIRQLISLPAGFVKMSLKSFIFYTSLGSFIWVSILAALGYFFGANEELWQGYYKEISYILGFMAIAVLLIFIPIQVRKKRKKKK